MAPALDFRLLFEAVPDLLVVVLPDAPVFTIAAASDVYLEAVRKKREEILGKGLFDAFPQSPETVQGEAAVNLRASFQRVIETRQTDRLPTQQYDLIVPGTSAADVRYWRMVSSPIAGEDGSLQFILHRVEDMTARVVADAKLRESEDHFRHTVELSTQVPWTADANGQILDFSQKWLDMTGMTREEALGEGWKHVPHPEDQPQMVAAWNTSLRTGQPYNVEHRIRMADGTFRWMHSQAFPRYDTDGRIISWYGTTEDVDARKRGELLNGFLVHLDDAVRALTDPHEITQTAARLLGERLRVSRCAYADVEEDQNTFNLTGDYNRGVPSIVGRYTFDQFGQGCLLAMRENRPWVVTESETDPRIERERGAYRATMIRSVICVPLQKEGRFVAAMAVHDVEPRLWQQDEIELLLLVASRCWESIERARVTRELRHRVQRYRFLAESIPQMVWTATPDGELDYVNEQVTQYVGVPSEAVLRDGWMRWVHPDDQAHSRELWQRSAATGERYETFCRLLRGSDRTWRWHLVRAQALFSGSQIAQWFSTSTDIEDQKQAEAHLRQQWHTFDIALSHTPDFTYIFDLEGRFTYVNRALLTLWELKFEEAIGKTFFELKYPPELAAKLQWQIQQVIDTHENIRDQTPFTGPSGETRYYEYIFVPVLGSDGNVNAVAGSTRDITEHRNAETLAEEDRRRWRDLLLQTPAAIALLRGPDFLFEWANPEYLTLVGRSAEELLGKELIRALPEVAAQTYMSVLQRVYQTGESFVGHEAPVLLSLNKGEPRVVYVNFAYIATRDLAGQIDGVFVHAVDVTAMVRARQQVEESEKQFRTLAESIPHLASMGDQDGNIFWYNRRWYEYTGTTFEEMAGWGWEKVHDPRVLPQVVEQWKKAILTGTPFEMVFPLRAADGTFRQFLTRVEPLFDAQGKAVRWFGTNTDITEQLRTEEKLRKMNRELEEFSYVASHDLQEPLRMVNIYSHLILRRIGEDEQLRQYGDFVRQGVGRMEALIQGLLTFSRTVHQDEEPDSVKADLSLALAEAMLVLKNSIEETGAVITTGDLPVVHGEFPQFAHVFQNLLSNALKYHRPGVPPRIGVSASLSDEEWLVCVEDEGIGFEPRYADRIFGLFKRLHKDEYPGTGLGLAICKRIVERYGGRMWGEGSPGQGAKFYLALPRVEDQ